MVTSACFKHVLTPLANGTFVSQVTSALPTHARVAAPPNRPLISRQRAPNQSQQAHTRKRPLTHTTRTEKWEY